MKPRLIKRKKEKKSGGKLPFTSVIVPAHSAQDNIVKLINSLLNQSYPKNLYEIIVVDNNSSDQTKEIASLFPVKVLEEKKIQSSYAARNTGIRNAKGTVLAFIDSDCVATRNWIEEGVRALSSNSADLAGGKVQFTFSKRKTAAEVYDSVTHMQIESNIREQNVAKTANLFVRSYLFDKVGEFPDSVKSGGDVQWTGRATRAGFLLVYAPLAVVQHPARGFKGLIKKQYRIGKGMLGIRRGRGRSVGFSWFLRALLRLVLPPKPKRPINRWFVSYACKAATELGVLTSLLDWKGSRNNNEAE